MRLPLVLVLVVAMAPARGWAQGALIDARLLAAYVATQEALAADDFTAAKVAMTSVAAVVAPALQPLARAVADARDIKAFRVAFKPFSAELIKLALPAGYAVAFCPMFDNNKGANWIQKAGEVANPYYGQEMLRCGTIDSSPGSHMDHSPRYGGIFFMAPDAFHHVEGTYPEPGVFRVRVYDNFTKEMDPTSVTARAVVQELYDETTREFREVVAVPLVADARGYLEARVGALPTPAEITAKITFTAGGPEERFDFIFAAPTPEASPTARVAEALPPTTLRLFDAETDPIPATAAGIVEQIVRRDTRIQELVRGGAFTEVFIPALEAKELALALESHLSSEPADRQLRVREAIRALVRAAWLLDWYGDLGNRARVAEAYGLFGPAVGDLQSVYSAK